MGYAKVNLCQDKEIGLSCFGCCGNNFNEEDIMQDLRVNTIQFELSKDIHEFMARGKDLRLSGICKHMIIKEGKIVCPAHPKQNEGKEYRHGECNILYECKTSFEYNSWSQKKQQEFIKFIKEKDLDSVKYSIMVDNGSLLREFLSQK